MKNSDNKIVLSMFKNYGKSTKELVNICEKEFEDLEFEFYDYLRSINLSGAAKRFTMYWKLESFIEKAIYENPYLNNPELIIYSVENWNKLNQVKIDTEVVLYLMTRKGMKQDTGKKAFLALCDGDVETYKIYQKEKPELLANILVRYLMSYYNNKNKVISVGKEAMNNLFGDVYSSQVENTFNNIFGILKNFQKQNIIYGRIIGPDEFIFSNGIKSIIDPFMAREDESETNNEVGEIIEKSTDKNICDDRIKNEYDCEDKSVDTLESLENTISLLNDQFKVFKMGLSEKAADIETQLREKTTYLETQISILNNKIEEAREGAIIDLIRKIAGKGASYQLSELFMETTGDKESDREIMVGKLVNLFSMLELEEIYAYAQGKNIGDKFSITKSDLAKKYMVTDAIRSNDELVNVELVHYGWNYKDKRVVMPLVREVL